MTNKFDWLRAVHADERISAAEKVILSHAAIFDVLNGADTFCVRQTTLAAHCAVSERIAKQAIGTAKRLGYLVVSQPRKRGYGQHRADELRLKIPESDADLSADSAPHSLELGAEITRSQVQKLQELGADSAHTFRNKGLSNGSLRKGLAPALELNSESAPHCKVANCTPSACPKHPDGPHHSQKCHQCRVWRESLEAESQRIEEAAEQKRRRRRQTIDECEKCDDNGWVEVRGSNALQRCDHSTEKAARQHDI